MVEKSAPKFAADALASKAPKPMPPPLSHPLQDALLQAIAERGGVRHFPANAVLVHEDDVSDSLYIMLSGRAKVYGSSSSGREVVYNTLVAGEYFGEMSLDGGPRSASVMTLEASAVVVVPGGQVRDFLANHPDFALHLVRKLIALVRRQTGTVKSLALDDVYGRIAKVLLSLSRDEGEVKVVDVKLTQQDIADRVGSSREMVSRIFTQLTQGGYVAVHRGHISLLKKLPARW